MQLFIDTITKVNNEFHFGLNKFQIELLAIRIKQAQDENWRAFLGQPGLADKQTNKLRVVK
jgi:predicted metalloenzyme YecM